MARWVILKGRNKPTPTGCECCREITKRSQIPPGKCWSSGKSMMLQGWRQQRGRPSPAVKRAATLGLWRPAMGSPQLSAECRGRIEIDETKPNDHRRCSTFQNRNCAKHWNAKLAPIDPGGNRSSAAAFGRVASEGMGSRSQRNGETKPLRSVAMLRRDYQTKPNTSDKCWSSGKSMILHHRRRSAVGLTRSRKCEACSIVPFPSACGFASSAAGRGRRKQ